jgi:hypothetical protein
LKIAYQPHWIDDGLMVARKELEGNLSHLALHSQKIHTALQHLQLLYLKDHSNLGTDRSHTHLTRSQLSTALTYQSIKQCVDTTNDSHTHRKCCKIITAFVVT